MLVVLVDELCLEAIICNCVGRLFKCTHEQFVLIILLGGDVLLCLFYRIVLSSGEVEVYYTSFMQVVGKRDHYIYIVM